MIRKAVIPAAGYGTRFLPATKSQPKEMLPIVDTPVIQYVVEEAVASGITDILMIIGKGKRAIEEHFDRHFDLENELERKGRMAEAEEIRRVSTMANIHFIWQREMNGLGDAIRYARHHVGDEPFVVMLGDTLLEDHTRREPITRQMVDLYERYGESVVAMEEVPEHKVHRYGIVDGKPVGDHVWQIRDLIEKPTPEEAPSRMAIAGRYILTPDIFEHLEQTPPGKNGEIQLTDAMRRMVRARPMYGLHFEGTRHDIGNRLDFLRTNITFALRRPELAGALKEFLRGTVEHMDVVPPAAPGGPAA